MSQSLTLRGVGVSVAGRSLMAGVDLELSAGEIVALTGPSGCGKTTLLRSVAALADVEAGEIRLGKRAPFDLGFPAWRRRVTYVAQQPVMLGATVRGNLSRPFSYAAVGDPFPAARAEELLAALGLEGIDVLEQEASTLSVGEKQRVSLVRALVIEPQVLLLDEPTSALDDRSARAVEEVLRGFAAGGGAALAVTHDPAQVDRFCHRRLDLEPYLAERRVV